MSASTQFGQLGALVGDVTSLLAATAAITTAWVRRANWLPPENDVPGGPAKVAGLISAIAIGMLWYETGKTLFPPELELIAAILGGITVLALLVYVFVINIYVYTKEVAIDAHRTREERVVGGFWLTPEAKRVLKKAGTIQNLFAGGGYDPDRIWPRSARSLAKVLFLLAFLALQVSGSIAISAIALTFRARM